MTRCLSDAELIRQLHRALELAIIDMERVGIRYGPQTNAARAVRAYRHWRDKLMSETPRSDAPTMDEFNALKEQVELQGAEIVDLENRVTALENGGGIAPPSRTPSPDGTEVTDTSGEIIDDQLRCFSLVGPADNYRIDCDGAISGGGVLRLYAQDGRCYQENYQHSWWYMGDENEWIASDNPTGEAQPIDPPSGDYTFADEFNELSLWNRDAPDDSKVWRPSRWYSPDEWDGWNCNAGRMVNPYKQHGCHPLYGVNTEGQLFLAIDRHNDEYGDCRSQPFVTTQINQLSFKQLGGYWEARIKCPSIKGTNFAFWLMNSVSWPPEVDILELVTFTDGNAVMSQNLWETNQKTNPYYLWSFDRTAWHTYAFWWDRDNGKMRYFFDGALTQELDQPTGYDHPMFAILSSQQGGDWSGPIPDNEPMGQMLVDYCHVSAAPPGAVLSAPRAAPSGLCERPLRSALGQSVSFERLTSRR